MFMMDYLRQEEKPETIALWREAFPEDSSRFLDYYYQEKTTDNRILAIRDGERAGRPIVSMLQRNPYTLRAANHVLESDYIVAVATAKERRHQGLMRKLLDKLMEDMHKEGRPFCYLMPADRRIYEPFGFVYIYDQEHWELTKQGEEALTTRRIERETAGEAAGWMNRWLAKRYDVFAIRDEGYVARLLRELESEDGWLEFLYESREDALGQEEPVGIRGFWGVKEREQRMLLCEEGCRQVQKEKTPAVMARITDVEACLRMVCLRDESPVDRLEIVLEVEDGRCPWNRGSFLWTVEKSGSDIRRQKREGIPFLPIGIGPLTQWIFGYKEPWEPGAGERPDTGWQRWIATWKGVFLDEIV